MELTDSEKGPEQKSGTHSQHSTADFAEGELVLVSEGPALARTFNLLSACATGITTGNSWAVLGAGIVTSLHNGGAAGAIYEYAVVSILYGFIAASIAELASSIPSSGGVYHWALVTAGTKYGKICGWFAGWLNGLAWMFAVASNCVMVSNMVLWSYKLYRPELEPQRWQVFVCYLIMSWGCCFTVIFAQNSLPLISRLGSFLIITGFFVTVIVCAVMPGLAGGGYASSEFVWKQWNNGTGYSSDGFVFLAGMLNGAYAVGAIDCVTHIAEEIPRPRVNLPKALACQVIMGFVTGFSYLIVVFYATKNLEAIIELETICPIGEMYLQATGSKGGAVGLLIVIILPILCATVGCYVTAGRTLYALGRDGATPFANKIGAVSSRWQSPLYSTLACGIFMTCIGAVYVGSLTAFNAFIGSFVVLSTLSYLLAILPHLVSGRKLIKPGPFWMGRFGAAVNAVACLYIVVSIVIYCFPYSLPTTAEAMNYTSVIISGLAVVVGLWWMLHGRRHYQGPRADLQV
ncbi:hypothetical protein COCC4DRAFT_55832 [Bipolaris maydis ATCC 48331]|uniref:Choline transport protein n=2 Tax=Cochliobolus heterostrophus TaxID=5016 RepID=M2URW4_COCH5|nr:uncharacterized protein COCC4DRAFT_55832 [Bipolaris maydis ATCC 48331]EMD96311.1 hypothetical protein COCHEDRAFT_1152371 [Bipolaris maydis C5]KAJ5065987.1 amino acid/polyamine transporter I [Bipolaris maydis]ENI11171.1 hypothetical protein COCC4DRAFT_55832 [Bipolaris maydis ATCC 48331]KAJ6201187.1 amino acid/polyamine transporter I [Bipolaris maydis]KAJ6212940.1 amino acid/polyamine transporter I [Bipolaris maydis]